MWARFFDSNADGFSPIRVIIPGMDELLNTTIGRIVAVLGAGGLIFFLLSLHQLWRGNRAPYWRARRAAGQRGGQLFLIAFTLFGLAGAVAIFGGLGSLAIGDSLPESDEPGVAQIITATPGPTLDIDATIAVAVDAAVGATLAALPTATSPPAIVVTATEPPVTATATSTPTVTPSPTLTPTVTPNYLARFDGLLDDTIAAVDANAPEDATLAIDALATGIRLDAQPQNPGTRFDAGFTRLYVFYTFESMAGGTMWSYTLYYRERAVASRSAVWSDGSEGEEFLFVEVSAGFPPGAYTMRLYAGNRETDRTEFVVDDS